MLLYTYWKRGCVSSPNVRPILEISGADGRVHLEHELDFACIMTHNWLSLLYLNVDSPAVSYKSFNRISLRPSFLAGNDFIHGVEILDFLFGLACMGICSGGAMHRCLVTWITLCRASFYCFITSMILTRIF